MNSITQGNALSKHGAEFNGKATEVGQDIKDLGKITGALAGDATNKVKENVAHYVEQGKGLYAQGVKEAQKLEEKVESRVQKNPIQSLLIIGGIGLVLGALWNRR